MGITKLKCNRCSHEWIPRIENTKTCPKCKSYNFNRKEVRKYAKRNDQSIA